MLYIDTSLLVPLVIEEPQSERVRAWFASVASGTLVTSEWSRLEFLSVLGIRARQKVLGVARAQLAARTLQEFVRESLVVVQPAGGSFQKAATLLQALPSGLRAGDALHLAVALEERAGGLATLDLKLQKAARALKLPLKVVTAA